MNHFINYAPLYFTVIGVISAIFFFYSVHECTIKKHGYMKTHTNVFKRPMATFNLHGTTTGRITAKASVNVGTRGHIDHGSPKSTQKPS